MLFGTRLTGQRDRGDGDRVPNPPQPGAPHDHRHRRGLDAGDLIGLVGNSGNSDEPHLHLQAQNNPVFDVLQPPKGLRTYPLLIEHVSVRRDGREFTPARADLRRADIFQPVG